MQHNLLFHFAFHVSQNFTISKKFVSFTMFIVFLQLFIQL
jgi:hypothetical protein